MPDDLDRLASIATRRDTLLFVGSGVSAWSGLPTWRKMLDKLANYLEARGISAELVRRELGNNDLLLAASFGFDRLSLPERCDFLRSTIHSKSVGPSDLHRTIAKLGPRCFVTTNYDTLLESAIREARPEEAFNVVTPLQQLEVASIVQSRAEGFVFKPHGDIGSCDSIILTREDYRSFHGERRNILEATRTLLASRPVIFLGFGLRDPDFLLIHDLLASTFGTSPADHYAIMPDTLPGEAEYWLRNYGLRLVSYITDRDAPEIDRHRPLLDLLNSIQVKAEHLASGRRIAAIEDKNALLLALARHSRRLQSSNPSTEEIIPLRLRSRGKYRGKEAFSYLPGRNAHTVLRTAENSFILEGSPGAGKTFLVRQAVHHLSKILEENCLAAEDVALGDLKVPVLISLRDYNGNIEEMLTQALPIDISFDDLISWGTGVFFLDGVNEAPIEYAESKSLLNDLNILLKRVGHSVVVITTRFGDELDALNLPVMVLDEISAKYIQQEILISDQSELPIDDEVDALLQRPLFYRAWKDGDLNLREVRTVHDIYSQLISKLERDANRVLNLNARFSELFARLAYDMIDSGQLAAPVSRVYASLQASLPQTVDAQAFVNYLVGQGTLLATPSRKLAFFHHSVAEYFAAHHLASLLKIDRSAIRRCLGRRDWDQAVLLSLGFLEGENAEQVFSEIMLTDQLMTLRALNYVESQRGVWTTYALDHLASMPVRDFRIEVELQRPLAALMVGPEHASALRKIIDRGEILGGVAASLLWTVDGRKMGDLVRLIDGSHGLSFTSAMSQFVAPYIRPEEALALLDALRHRTLDSDTTEKLRTGVEIPEYIAIFSALRNVLSVVSTQTLVDFVREDDSILIRRVVCEALDHRRTPDAVAFVQRCILRGDEYAIVTLYFQLTYGEPRDSAIPCVDSQLVQVLVSQMAGGTQAQWALGTLKTLVSRGMAPNWDSQIIVDDRTGLMGGLLCLIGNDLAGFWRCLEGLVENSTDWDAEPVSALQYAQVSWVGHEDLFLRLLSQRHDGLAHALVQSVSSGKRSIEVPVGDLDWLIEWISDEDASSDFVLASNLGHFLSSGTDEITRRKLVRMFDESARFRSTLSRYVLPLLPDLSMGDLSADTMEWLVGELNDHIYDPLSLPLIIKVATEDFVQHRLIPLYLENPPEPLRTNLRLCLDELGRIHRLRYTRDDGQLLG